MCACVILIHISEVKSQSEVFRIHKTSVGDILLLKYIRIALENTIF